MEDNTKIEQSSRKTDSKNKVPMARIAVFTMLIGLVSGTIGGVAGYSLLRDITPISSINRQEVVLQESSVIIDVAETISPSVVSIQTTGEERFDIFGRRFQQTTGSGTGVILSKDGLVLTNKHVVADSSAIAVYTEDGSEYEAEIIDSDPFNDLAYIRLKGASDLVPAELGDSDQVVVGQKVIAIGNALGEFDNTVTSGIISGNGRPVTAGDSATGDTDSLQDLFQTDAAINPGNSGGPLVNIEGQVIGLNTAVADGAENIGFAIPINQAKSGIESIERTGRLVKPYLGVSFVMLNKSIAETRNLPVEQGAYIFADLNSQAVLPDSPAAKAGLRDGDIIIKINEHELGDGKSLSTIINRYMPGEAVTLTIRRGDETTELQTVLEEVPEALAS